MIPSNPIPQVPNYGSSAQYRDLPSEEQIRAGVIPLDSLPAAWWNAMWFCTNGAVNEARSAVGTLITEVCNAITGAGICINESCVDQLYQAIETIRQRVGNAITAGAVKSSSACGEVSIDANGIMTANGVGNAALLNTTSKVVVGAINELKTTYDCCFSDLSGCIGSVDNSKAPTNHVSSAATYGVGNADCYGHLKISDEYTCCVGNAADGVAASQMALYCVYNAIQAAASLGNAAGCPLGTAAAGTATTAARSDHVHPLPDSFKSYNDTWYIYAGWNLCNDNRYYLYGATTSGSSNRCGFHVDYASRAENAGAANYASGAGEANISCRANATCWNGSAVCLYYSSGDVCICNKTSNDVMVMPDCAHVIGSGLYRCLTSRYIMVAGLYLPANARYCLYCCSAWSGLSAQTLKGVGVW